MICTLIFRHGQSLANLATGLTMNRRHHEIPDIYWKLKDQTYPLTDSGIQQAAVLADYLSEILEGKKVLAVSSPFVRAEATARIALPETKWTLDDRLIERDYGSITKLKLLNLPEELKKEQERANTDPDYRPCGDGESFRSHCVRVAEAFAHWQAQAETKGAEILVASAHGDVIRALRSHIFEHDLDVTPYWFHIGNCQIHHFTPRCPEGSSVVGLWHGEDPMPYEETKWSRVR